jgi:HEAT repeat protein
MSRKSIVIAIAIAAFFIGPARADISYYPLSTDETYLAGLLESGDDELVSQALRDLSGRATPASVPALLDFIERTDNPELFTRAAGILKRIGDTAAAEPVRDQLAGMDRFPLREPTPEFIAKYEDRYRRLEGEAEIAEALTSQWRSAVVDAAASLADVLLTLDPALARKTFEEMIDQPAGEVQLDGIYSALVKQTDAESARLAERCMELRRDDDIVETCRLLLKAETDDAFRKYLTILENPETPRRDEILALDIHRRGGLSRELIEEYRRVLRTIILHDPDPATMAQAVEQFCRYTPDEEMAEVDRYLQTLYEAHPETIDRALYSNLLRRNQEVGLSIARTLIQRGLPEKQGWFIETVVVGLVHLGGDVHGFLDEAFHSPDPAVRGAALREMVFHKQTYTLTYGLEALNDPSPGVRWEAAKLVQQLLDAYPRTWTYSTSVPEVFDILSAAVEREENQSVFEALTLDLGATKDPRAVPVLVGIYEEADPADEHTRGGMLYILRNMSIPEADAALARLEDTGVGGLNWLRSILFDPSPGDIEIIRGRCLNDPDPEVRRLGFLIYIDDTEDPDAGLLADRLARDPDESVRETVADGMARKHLDAPTETLAAALNNENSWKVLESLSEMIENHAGWSAELEEAVLDNYRRLLALPPVLRTEYSSEAYEYQRAVVGLLGALMKNRPEKAFTLIRDYMEKDTIPDVKSGMVRLLGDYDHPDCVEYLKQLLRESPLVGVQLSAMGALDALIGAEAADDVAPLLETGAGDLPWNAVEKLSKWGDPRGLEFILAYLEEHGASSLFKHYDDLARYDDPRAEALLFELVEKPECRLSILQALGERHDRRTEEYLAGAVESGDSWEVASAFRSLCRMRSPLALELFGGLHARAETGDDAYNLYRPLAEYYGGPEAVALLAGAYRELEIEPVRDDMRMRSILHQLGTNACAEAEGFLREVAEGEDEMAELARKYISRTDD